MAALFFAVYLSAVFLNARILAFAAEYPKYQQQFVEIVSDIGEKTNLPYNPLAEVNWGRTVGSWLMTLSGSLLSILSNLTMIIIFLVFMLIGHPYFPHKVKKALSGPNADRFIHIGSSISSQITRYLSVQFMISFATGVLVWVALSLIGVDFPATWGAFAFFLNFIPTIGSIIATVPPIILALVQFYPNIIPGIITFISLLGIQMVLGNGVAPKVLGDRLNLSPVVILVSLLFWGWLWGPIGALLSVLITSAIKIICENIEELRPISVMMGLGRVYLREFEESG